MPWLPETVDEAHLAPLPKMIRYLVQKRREIKALIKGEKDKLKRKYLTALVLGLRLAREERTATDKHRRDLCGNALKALFVVS